jgi:hypothetical protein
VNSYTIIVLAVALIASTSCRTEPPPSKPDEVCGVGEPVGLLGYRIGTYLTIEGVRAEQGKVGVHTLLVDRVGDHRLDTPVRVWVSNVKLPAGERCVLKGYETGGWGGVPPEVLRATGQRGPQAVWQFHFDFIATSVVQPDDARWSSSVPIDPETGLPISDVKSKQQ